MLTQRIARLTDTYPTLRRVLWPAIALRRRLRAGPKPDLKAVLDRLARSLAEDPVLDVPEFQGRFAMAARSRLFRRLVEHGEYEPVLTRRCLELLDPDRDVIDVGANIGFHTVLLSRQLRAGRLLAVEPTANALRRLRRNVELNGVGDKVTVFEGVASNAPGSLEISTVNDAEEFSSLGGIRHPAMAGVPTTLERVAATTIDELTQTLGLAPGFIKIDVEGFEHFVFEGAVHTLETHRPVIVSELSDYLLRRNGASALAIVERLRRFDYDVVDPLHPGEAPGYREFGDIVCVPR
jgi:FkbM family methyltransferase